VLGVQWHPEADQTSQVVRALVAEAERGPGAERIGAAHGTPLLAPADTPT
jgi:aspartate oxidase